MTEEMYANRRALFAATVVLAATAALFVVFGFTLDSNWFWIALSALVAMQGPLIECLIGRYRLGVASFWAAGVISISQKLVGSEETITISGVALVTLAVLQVMLYRKAIRLAGAVGWAIVLGLLPLWWDGVAGVWVGLGLAGGFVFMAWIQEELLGVYRRSLRIRRRVDEVLARTAIPIMDMDFSGVIDELTELHRTVPDVARHLLDHPRDLERLYTSVAVTNMNPAALVELRAEDVEFPIPPATHVHTENAGQVASWLAALAAGARQWDGMLLAEGFDGRSLWFAVRHIVVGDPPDYRRTIITGMNITEQRTVQEQLEQLDFSKNEFIATITHEMRTPLAGVVGFSSELADHLDEYDSVDAREMLQLINRQSREISHILDDLMIAAAADLESLRVSPEIVDVRAVLRDVIDKSGVDIDVPASPTTVYAYADPVRLRQIVRNLLTNVQRYGGDHRRIEIAPSAERVRVSVVDDGPGMPQEQVDQIFGRYETVASSHVEGSMGLGLNVSRTLADLMGARLRYERLAGETYFHIEMLRLDPHRSAETMQATR